MDAINERRRFCAAMAESCGAGRRHRLWHRHRRAARPRPLRGMALAIPLVMSWEPATALIFMGALYKCSNYGGSLTAILVNTPGDASNAATVLDGYPMCERGRGGVALDSAPPPR